MAHPLPTSTVDAAAAFLAGPGRRVAARAVAGLGLPAHRAAAVAQEALRRVVRAAARGVAVPHLEAFTTVLVQRAAKDLLRGVRRRPEGHAAADPLEDLGPAVLGGRLDDDLPDAAVVSAEGADELRRRVAA